jgi:hypothetical protein
MERATLSGVACFSNVIQVGGETCQGAGNYWKWIIWKNFMAVNPENPL